MSGLKAVPSGGIGGWMAFSEAYIAQVFSKLNVSLISLESYLKFCLG